MNTRNTTGDSHVLHKDTTTKMRKTSDGAIYAKDIENTFAMLIIYLPLTEHSNTSKRGFFAKSYPYTFTVDDAIEKMQTMQVVIDNGNTTTTITCGVRKSGVMGFLNKFMAARLIHCPGDRTRSIIKPSVLLQPTAKGAHLLQRYCLKNGIKNPNVTKFLLSSYNSMRCISLDRHVHSDKLVKSYTFAYLLFQRFMGSKPNVFRPTNPPDDIPHNSIDTIYGQTQAFYSLKSPAHSDCFVLDSGSGHAHAIDRSPYAHRYFTHPDSDSLSQYYVSYKGVRLFHNKHFLGLDKRPQTVEYYMTGKAAFQWLLESTDVVYPAEAMELANLLVEHGLLEPYSCRLLLVVFRGWRVQRMHFIL